MTRASPQGHPGDYPPSFAAIVCVPRPRLRAPARWRAEFFLKLKPHLLSWCQSAGSFRAMPNSLARRWQSSAKVRSGCLAIQSRMRPSTGLCGNHGCYPAEGFWCYRSLQNASSPSRPRDDSPQIAWLYQLFHHHVQMPESLDLSDLGNSFAWHQPITNPNKKSIFISKVL